MEPLEPLDAEQKLTRGMLLLQRLHPFYAALYQVLEKRPDPETAALAVSTKLLRYNPQYVEDTPLPQLVFALLHEVFHTALMHAARRGGRDRRLWNMACDLYVNAMISQELGLYPGSGMTVDGVELFMPAGELFAASIDLERDFAEDIYVALEAQGLKNGYAASLCSVNTEGDSFRFEYEGKRHSSGYSPYHRRSRMFERFRQFSVDLHPDDCPNDLNDGGEDDSQLLQEAGQLVSDAVVRTQMLSSSAANAPPALMAQAQGMLESQADWRRLLRRYLIQSQTTDSTFARPDKRMLYQGAIYPGQAPDDTDAIRGIKVCLDTSASISDEDMARFCGQVYRLVRQFQVEAELLCWDTAIRSSGRFTDWKGFEGIPRAGRGGTDPSVLFEYFESKVCKVKPLVTLIFTDGRFDTGWATPALARRYRDTLWVMSREFDGSFAPPFGKKVVFRQA